MKSARQQKDIWCVNHWHDFTLLYVLVFNSEWRVSCKRILMTVPIPPSSGKPLEHTKHLHRLPYWEFWTLSSHFDLLHNELLHLIAHGSIFLQILADKQLCWFQHACSVLCQTLLSQVCPKAKVNRPRNYYCASAITITFFKERTHSFIKKVYSVCCSAIKLMRYCLKLTSTIPEREHCWELCWIQAF